MSPTNPPRKSAHQQATFFHRLPKQGDLNPPFESSTTPFLKPHASEYSSSESFLHRANKVLRCPLPRGQQFARAFRGFCYAALPNTIQQLAASTNAMENAPNLVFDNNIDWANIDLLEACYLPTSPLHSFYELLRASTRSPSIC